MNFIHGEKHTVGIERSKKFSYEDIFIYDYLGKSTKPDEKIGETSRKS